MVLDINDNVAQSGHPEVLLRSLITTIGWPGEKGRVLRTWPNPKDIQ